MTAFTVSVVEDGALIWLEALGYAILNGPEIAPGEPNAERAALVPKLTSGKLRVGDADSTQPAGPGE